MPKSFREMRKDLGERLLKAGVAPRHVRRYLRELADHLADLRAEEERAGRNPAEAESAALLRLGGIDDLFKAMAGQRQMQSWSARAPWAMFGGLQCVFGGRLFCGALFFVVGVENVSAVERNSFCQNLRSERPVFCRGPVALFHGAGTGGMGDWIGCGAAEIETRVAGNGGCRGGIARCGGSGTREPARGRKRTGEYAFCFGKQCADSRTCNFFSCGGAVPSLESAREVFFGGVDFWCEIPCQGRDRRSLADRSVRAACSIPQVHFRALIRATRSRAFCRACFT